MQALRWMVLGYLCWLATGLVAQQPVQHDSSELNIRTFDENQRQAYLEDEAYQYDRLRKETTESGFWDRFWKRIFGFLFEDRMGEVSVADIIGYMIAIGVLIFVVFGLLKVRMRGLFERRALKVAPEFKLENAALQQMDFEQLISAATQQGDFRKAVRLLYLETLKELSQSDHIQWRPNKTNQDYLVEMSHQALYEEFDALTREYDYAWYGDFPVGPEKYQSIEEIFRDFQQQLRAMT